MPQRIEYPTGRKTCTACAIEKPLSDFYSTKGRNGAPTSRCKACHSAAKPKYQRLLAVQSLTCGHCGETFTPKRRPDIAKYCSRRCSQTAWAKSKVARREPIVIVDGCRQCTRCREWKSLDLFGRRTDRSDAPLSQCRNCSREQSLAYQRSDHGRTKRYAKNYGVSLEWYEATVAAQNGVCAICGRPPEAENRLRPRLVIDHCHATGAVRGLLCFRCNSGLGLFVDTPDLLLRAVEYLMAHRTPD